MKDVLVTLHFKDSSYDSFSRICEEIGKKPDFVFSNIFAGWVCDFFERYGIGSFDVEGFNES